MWKGSSVVAVDIAADIGRVANESCSAVARGRVIDETGGAGTRGRVVDETSRAGARDKH